MLCSPENQCIWLVWDKKILTLDTLFTCGCNKLPTTTCPLCYTDNKTVDHLFFNCLVAMSIWNRLSLTFAFSRAPSFELELWGSWYSGIDPKYRLSCSLITRAVLWQIWLAKNDCLFNAVHISMPSLLLKTCYMFLSWILAISVKKMHRLEEHGDVASYSWIIVFRTPFLGGALP